MYVSWSATAISIAGINWPSCKMLPKQVVHILNIFDVFGYNSNATKISKKRHIAYIINFIHILFAIFLVIFVFHLTIKYFSVLLLTETVTENIQYFSGLYTYWLIILESLFCRKTHQQFWKLLNKIDEYYKSQENLNFRWFVAIMFVYAIKTAITVIVRVVIQPYASSEIDFAYTTLFIVWEMRMFYYLFCLQILHFQLNMIEEEFKTILSCTKNRNMPETEFDMNKQFKWIREYFCCTHQMIDLLNTIFGWSHVAVSSFFFAFLLSELNWYYIHFDQFSCIYKTRKFNRLVEFPRWSIFSSITIFFSHRCCYHTLDLDDILYFSNSHQLPY